MKRYVAVGVLMFALGIGAAFAAAPVKTYQVTGPVLAVDATTITVQKGTDKWVLAKDSSTKVTGDVKVGSNVTIQYLMTATTIDVKKPK